jgi:transcriptional antiterminator
MAGLGRTKNKSYFHYRLEKYNGDEKEYEKYYMTMKDIKEDYGISRHSISNMLKNPGLKSKKYKGLKVFRDYRPATQVVPIPQQNI